MSSDFLKLEIEAAHKARSTKRRIWLASSLCILCLLFMGFLLWHKNAPMHQTQESTLASENVDTKDPGGKRPSASGQPEQTIAPTVSPTANQPAHTSNPQSVQPVTPNFDSSAYITDANKTLAVYTQIIALLNFDTSTSDVVKVDRIIQAKALDKQAFGQVTNLRGHLVRSNVTGGKYMELTELAEGGVAKISAGLTFMSYWVDNHSRTNDLNIGSGTVSEGAGLLLRFADEI